MLASCASINNPKTQAVIACADLNEFQLAHYALTRLVKPKDDPKKPKTKTAERVDKVIESMDDDCFKHLDAKLKK